jgi:hypothetical protein
MDHDSLRRRVRGLAKHYAALGREFKRDLLRLVGLVEEQDQRIEELEAKLEKANEQTGHALELARFMTPIHDPSPIVVFSTGLAPWDTVQGRIEKPESDEDVDKEPSSLDLPMPRL